MKAAGLMVQAAASGMDDAMVLVSAEQLFRQITGVFARWGMAEQHAARDGGAFQEDLEALNARMRGNEPVDPAQPVLVPGDPEHAMLVQRKREGIPMLPTLVAEIRQVCVDAGAPFLLGTP